MRIRIFTIAAALAVVMMSAFFFGFSPAHAGGIGDLSMTVSIGSIETHKWVGKNEGIMVTAYTHAVNYNAIPITVTFFIKTDSSTFLTKNGNNVYAAQVFTPNSDNVYHQAKLFIPYKSLPASFSKYTYYLAEVQMNAFVGQFPTGQNLWAISNDVSFKVGQQIDPGPILKGVSE